MMSSALYSHFAAKHIPVPKVNFVKVVVNGRSWGIYASAQQFNKTFVKEHYGSKKGSRWKVKGNPRGDGVSIAMATGLGPVTTAFIWTRLVSSISFPMT